MTPTELNIASTLLKTCRKHVDPFSYLRNDLVRVKTKLNRLTRGIHPNNSRTRWDSSPTLKISIMCPNRPGPTINPFKIRWTKIKTNLGTLTIVKFSDLTNHLPKKPTISANQWTIDRAKWITETLHRTSKDVSKALSNPKAINMSPNAETNRLVKLTNLHPSPNDLQCTANSISNNNSIKSPKVATGISKSKILLVRKPSLEWRIAPT